MKKILSALLSMALILSFIGCNNDNSQSENPEKLPNPKDIVCRSISTNEWKTVAISHGDEDFSIAIPLPSDWTMTQNENGFDIARNGDNIGFISRQKVSLPEKAYKSKDVTNGGLRGEYRLYFTDGDFRHNFSFCYGNAKGEDCFAVLDVKMEELDSFASNRIIDRTELHTPEPFISGDFRLKNGSKRILIIGNSFVASSNIGSILQSLCESKGYIVDAHSRGYATVRTYSDDPSIISSIREGNYCAVFICGFYDGDVIEALGIVKSACEASNTLPVIFPAHNEQPAVYGSALTRYPDIAFVNWRDEIGSLINGGVPTSEMCINDSHQHSTPLAGYVGAHMIYRALFNSVPPHAISQDTGLNINQIDNILGDYSRTGDCGYMDNTKVDMTLDLSK